jgi:hypothetical protein
MDDVHDLPGLVTPGSLGSQDSMQDPVSMHEVSEASQSSSSDHKARITKLGTHGRRVMQYYAGNTPEATINPPLPRSGRKVREGTKANSSGCVRSVTRPSPLSRK